jgi:hypothetical protein
MWIKLEPLTAQLRVSWGNNAGLYPDSYFIGPRSLEITASALRDELKRLSGWARATDPEVRWAGLTALAKAGSDLRYELFKDPEHRAQIQSLEAWIADEYRDGDSELSIQADSSIHVPWGLVYDGDVPGNYVPAPNPGNAEAVAMHEMAAFGGFWSLKFRVSATPSGDRRSRLRLTRPRKTFGLLSLVDEDVQNQLVTDLGEAKYREFYDLLSRPPVGVAYNLASCQDLIDHTEQVDILFHFLGHHQQERLDLGRGGKVDYVQFSRLLDALADRQSRRGAQPCGLLFVNGCESAVGDEDYTLRSETKRPELCGIIATESVVRRTYAAEFGYRFLQAMVVGGKTVANTMDELHHDAGLWPESLLYGCYARPDYCIERPTVTATAQSGVAAEAAAVAGAS